MPSFGLGDDVSHAAFGAGVVIGVESGGIVVVRFAGDGSERKLMAEYAPITKAALNSRAMSAQIIDGRRSPGACGSASRRTSRRSPSSSAARAPASRRSSSATTPARRSTSAASRRPAARSACRASTTRCRRDTPRAEVVALIERLNADPEVSGILVQLPVPPHLDGVELTGLVDPSKDVDGLTAVSAGLLMLGREGLRPCTPLGVMTLLHAAGAELEGAEAVVIGRSNLFGKPMAQLLLGANATVTTCHSRTRDLAAVCRRADVLIAAVGQARMVKADWVKPGATVIDVGMNRTTTLHPASSATSTSTRSRRSRARSRRSPAASAR